MNNSRSYRYRVVDVFTRTPLEGNPLAVFPVASGIDDLTMQKIARETNLSETVFVLPTARADCAVRLRIFTPVKELPFAGHPTIGTSFVLLDERIVPEDSERFVLDEKVGPVPIRVDAGDRPLIWLRTPPISWGRSFERSHAAQALGLEGSDLLDCVPEVVSAGNPFVFIALSSRDAVDRAWLDSNGVSMMKGADADPIGIFVFTPTSAGAYSRMFAPEFGVVEDPATGSATGPLAAYMMKHKLIAGTHGTRFISEQGVKMGRRSILYVEIHGENGSEGIDVGGYVTPIIEATMTL